MTADRFVVRIWGLHYDYGTHEDPGPGEVWTVGWLTKSGQCTSNKVQAMFYESEADAWMHASSVEVLGHDEQRGDWAWVEKDK